MFCRHCSLLFTSGLNLNVVLKVTFLGTHLFSGGCSQTCSCWSEWAGGDLYSHIKLIPLKKTLWNVCPCQLHTRTCRASTRGVSSPSELNSFLNFLLLTFCQRFYLNIAKYSHCEKTGGSRNKCKAELNVLCNLCGQQGLCCACGSTPSANTGHTSKHSLGRSHFAEGQSR